MSAIYYLILHGPAIPNANRGDFVRIDRRADRFAENLRFSGTCVRSGDLNRDLRQYSCDSPLAR